LIEYVNLFGLSISIYTIVLWDKDEQSMFQEDILGFPKNFAGQKVGFKVSPTKSED